MKLKHEFTKISLAGILIFNMVVLSACSVPGSAEKENLAGKNTETKPASVSVSNDEKDVTVGGLKENGYSLKVEKETLPDGANISVTPMKEEEKENLLSSGKYDALGTVFHIESDKYQGEFFDRDILLTVPLPTEMDEKTDLGGYAFLYINEENGTERYLFPSSFDTKQGTMTLRLPHFSLFAPARLSEKEQVEAFLDSYSTKLAVEKGRVKKMAKELAPYVKAKAEALNLTKEATADLVQSTLNYIGGKFEGDYKGAIETGTKAGTSLIRVAIDGDMDGLKANLEDTVNGAIMHVWEEKKYSNKIDEVCKIKGLGKASEKVVGNINGVAKMAGYLLEGDVENGMKELGGVLQSINPAAELTTKGARFLGSLANLSLTYWKSNEVEELFHIYKNGGTGIRGTEILPQDDESFLDYLEVGSDFSKGRALMRFLRMDRLNDFLKRSDWKEKDFQNLPEKTREKFAAKAEQELLEYFKIRIEQEEEAKKIKEEERICIEDMLNSHNGALRSYNYGKFFGEEARDDFDLTRRMERLVRVRAFISQYVDEAELKKYSKYKGGYNYGYLLNEWVKLASENPKDEAISKFKDFLKEIKFLKKEFLSQGNIKFVCIANNVDYASFPEDKREMYDSSLIEQAIRQGSAQATVLLKEDGSLSILAKKVKNEDEAHDKTGDKGEFEHIHRYYSFLKGMKMLGKINFDNPEKSILKEFVAVANGNYSYTFVLNANGQKHKSITEIKSEAKWKEKKNDKIEYYKAAADDGNTYQFIHIQTQINIPRKVKKIQRSSSKGVEEEKEIKLSLPCNLDLIYRSEKPVN